MIWKIWSLIGKNKPNFAYPILILHNPSHATNDVAERKLMVLLLLQIFTWKISILQVLKSFWLSAGFLELINKCIFEIRFFCYHQVIFTIKIGALKVAFFNLLQISIKRCQKSIFSLLEYCSGQWLGTFFLRFERKWKTFWD